MLDEYFLSKGPAIAQSCGTVTFSQTAFGRSRRNDHVPSRGVTNTPETDRTQAPKKDSATLIVRIVQRTSNTIPMLARSDPMSAEPAVQANASAFSASEAVTFSVFAPAVS